MAFIHIKKVDKESFTYYGQDPIPCLNPDLVPNFLFILFYTSFLSCRMTLPPEGRLHFNGKITTARLTAVTPYRERRKAHLRRLEV
jgi:hypothetical protein